MDEGAVDGRKATVNRFNLGEPQKLFILAAADEKPRANSLSIISKAVGSPLYRLADLQAVFYGKSVVFTCSARRRSAWGIISFQYQ